MTVARSPFSRHYRDSQCREDFGVAIDEDFHQDSRVASPCKYRLRLRRALLVYRHVQSHREHIENLCCVDFDGWPRDDQQLSLVSSLGALLGKLIVTVWLVEKGKDIPW